MEVSKYKCNTLVVVRRHVDHFRVLITLQLIQLVYARKFDFHMETVFGNVNFTHECVVIISSERIHLLNSFNGRNLISYLNVITLSQRCFLEILMNVNCKRE